VVRIKRCSRRARRHCRTRRVARPAIKVRYGHRLQIRGTLATRDGERLRGRPVEVVFTPVAGKPQRLPATRTSASGTVGYRLRPACSGTISLRYGGDRRILPAQQNVRASVPAPISIHTRAGLLFNGEAATFSGHIRGGGIPATGKLVEVQAYFRRAWRTIATTRSDRRGSWRFAYTFGGTTGTVHYRFRARVPAEGGYPFATGASKAARVTVRGL
jgi:hypothetical protein